MIFESNGIDVSVQTIRTILNNHGYNGRSMRKKCLLQKANIAKRLAIAKLHRNKPQSFWNNIIWSDECKFELFRSNRRCQVWRKANTAFKPRHVMSTVKHGGGSLMVWRHMSAAGPGK